MFVFYIFYNLFENVVYLKQHHCASFQKYNLVEKGLKSV